MISSLSTSAVHLINHAQNRANNAAQEIVSLSTQSKPANTLVNSAVELNQAKQEAEVSAKLLQVEKKTVGSLFDALS